MVCKHVPTHHPHPVQPPKGRSPVIAIADSVPAAARCCRSASTHVSGATLSMNGLSSDACLVVCLAALHAGNLWSVFTGATCAAFRFVAGAAAISAGDWWSARGLVTFCFVTDPETMPAILFFCVCWSASSQVSGADDPPELDGGPGGNDGAVDSDGAAVSLESASPAG